MINKLTYLDACEQARRLQLRIGLLDLAKWCTNRAGEDADSITTASLLERKLYKLASSVNNAGIDAVVNVITTSEIKGNAGE